jgi:hypothetical protein
MGLTRSERDAQLADLYARIPAIPDCDGRCWTSCGPIDMSDRERQRIRAAGVRITPYRQAMAGLEGFQCDALTGDRRCAVYDLRPLICRLWGAVEGLPCVYGCVPEGGRWLSDVDAHRMIAESLRIGGGDRGDAGATEAREGIRAEVDRIRVRARGVSGEKRRAADGVPAAFRRRSPRQRDAP